MSLRIFCYFFLLIQFSSIARGYRFSCIDFDGRSCDCDTDEELIDCNSRGWAKFPRLKSRLRGFSVMTLAFNNISGPLPNEKDVLQMLPDLELIDLRGNNRLDCDEILSKFDRVNVHSHCIEKELIKEQLSTTTAPPTPPTTPLPTTPTTLPTTTVPTPKYTFPIKPSPEPSTRTPFRFIFIKRLKTTTTPEPESEPEPLACLSLWCRLEHRVSNTYPKVYIQVHRVWVRMRNQFQEQQQQFQRRLYRFFP